MSDHNTNRIICQADQVALALRGLANKGLHAESVQLGGMRPVIWITPPRKADALPAAQYRRETIRGQIHCTYTALQMGCQIRWTATPPRGTEPTQKWGARRDLGVAA